MLEQAELNFSSPSNQSDVTANIYNGVDTPEADTSVFNFSFLSTFVNSYGSTASTFDDDDVSFSSSLLHPLIENDEENSDVFVEPIFHKNNIIQLSQSANYNHNCCGDTADEDRNLSQTDSENEQAFWTISALKKKRRRGVERFTNVVVLSSTKQVKPTSCPADPGPSRMISYNRAENPPRLQNLQYHPKNRERRSMPPSYSNPHETFHNVVSLRGCCEDVFQDDKKERLADGYFKPKNGFTKYSTSASSKHAASFNGYSTIKDNASDSSRSSENYLSALTSYYPEFLDDHKKLQQGFGSALKFIDTHCHLDLLFEKYSNEKKKSKIDNFETFLQGKKIKSTTSPHFQGCIADFCFPESFLKNNFQLWDSVSKSDKVWLALGCHPHQANLYDDDLEKVIEDRCSNNPKCVAIGELGLDYSQNNQVDHNIQKETLRRQLRLAMKIGKPILLHCRDAAEDCFEIFKEVVTQRDYPIHWHCYSDSVAMYKKWATHFTKTFFGVTLVLYAPRKHHWEFWAKCPLDRLLIETDAPYFLPKQYREKEFGHLQQCHPGLGALVALKLAEVKNLDPNVVLDQIWKNTLKIYKLNIVPQIKEN